MSDDPIFLQLWFDGLCEPRNPGGWACYGWIAKRDGQRVGSGAGLASGPGAASTNNAAEYAGLIAGLQALEGLPLAGVTVYGDSQLVINQMAGRWGCHAPGLVGLYNEARNLAERLGGVAWRWIPKEENTEADLLSWRAYRAARRAAP